MRAAEAGVGGHIGQHADVAFMVEHGAGDLLMRARFHLQGHAGIGAVERRDQGHAGHRVAQSHDDLPFAQRSAAEQQPLRFLPGFGHAFRRIADLEAKVRRQQPTRFATEQADAEFLFKSTHLRGNIGLADRKRPRGCRIGASLGHCPHGVQSLQRKRHLSNSELGFPKL